MCLVEKLIFMRKLRKGQGITSKVAIVENRYLNKILKETCGKITFVKSSFEELSPEIKGAKTYVSSYPIAEYLNIGVYDPDTNSKINLKGVEKIFLVGYEDTVLNVWKIEIEPNVEIVIENNEISLL